eukprot:3301351-Prymnesium_polylepis.1
MNDVSKTTPRAAPPGGVGCHERETARSSIESPAASACGVSSGASTMPAAPSLRATFGIRGAGGPNGGARSPERSRGAASGRCAVSMKLRPSLCQCSAVCGSCLPNATSRTPARTPHSSSAAIVCGKSSEIFCGSSLAMRTA